MTKKAIIIIISILIIFSCFAILLYRIHVGVFFSDNSSEWANFSTYFSGIVNPLISIIGFYLVITTIQKGDKTNRITNILNSISNIENQITKILEKRVYIKYKTETVFEEPIIKALRLDISEKEKVNRISDHKDMNQLNSQTMEIRNLRYFLIMLSELVEKISCIDPSNKDWLNIYKFKYHTIVECITHYEKYFFANALHELEEKSTKYYVISTKKRKYLDFFSYEEIE